MAQVLGIFSEQGKGREDVRVLRSQLGLAAQSVRATWTTSPLWGLALGLVCSDLLGVLGKNPLSRTLYLFKVSDGSIGHVRRFLRSCVDGSDT